MCSRIHRGRTCCDSKAVILFHMETYASLKERHWGLTKLISEGLYVGLLWSQVPFLHMSCQMPFCSRLALVSLSDPLCYIFPINKLRRKSKGKCLSFPSEPPLLWEANRARLLMCALLNCRQALFAVQLQVQSPFESNVNSLLSGHAALLWRCYGPSVLVCQTGGSRWGFFAHQDIIWFYGISLDLKTSPLLPLTKVNLAVWFMNHIIWSKWPDSTCV